MTDFERLLQALASGGVEYILIGGLAANAHGAIRTTRDIDVVYARARANLERLSKTLAPLHPYLRGAPPGLPFQLDVPTLQAGLNFTLTTDLGELDLLGEVAGGGGYDNLLADSMQLDLFGVNCRCLTLEALIRVKRAAGRPKDFSAVAELEALWQESQSLDKSASNEGGFMAKRKPSGAARPARSARRGSKARPVRREPETLRLRAIEPALTVDDINRSLTFYTDVLGFFVSDRFTDKSGVLLGVMLKAGACGLNLSQDDWSKGRDRQKGQGVSLWFHTAQDVDALAKRITAAGGRLAEGPKSEEWGGRSLTIDDPDGFRLRIYAQS